MKTVWQQVERIVKDALSEDIASGDVTTEALIPSDLRGKASILVKRDGVLAGIDVAREVFRQIDRSLRFKALAKDGTKVRKGQVVATVEGKAASILKAERTALNFLQHMSGIATETARYVEAVSGTRAVVTDTRKTIPGLRLLEKYAVRAGGGKNHRLNLADGVLIKDNHLVALRADEVGLGEAVKKARQRAPKGLKIEVEVESVPQAREALAAGADIIMLDNMKPEDMRKAVKLVKGKALLEASGGITPDNVRSVAETGVDLISIGALTHSARALDISLEFGIE
ncbi:MAG: carboxylating nicotinate-nucleotide diphosphorylase [Chloroflexi bacterium]|nr:carboxylating nicotinate-nucleotide diphosphorylase [Chloroflexota bacterium]